MASNQRERQLARQKYERQQTRRSAGAQRRGRRQKLIAAIVVVVLVAGSLAYVFISQRNNNDPVAGGTAEASALASELASELTPGPASAVASAAPSAAPTSVPSSGPSASQSGSTAPTALVCTPPVTARPDTLTWPSAPAVSAPTNKPTVITLTTNCGEIVIQTLPEAAPLTVASEVFLTDQGFYDSVACHRLTTQGIFVLQCGDPKGDGTGGPGYEVPDENLPVEGPANYPAGSVAMANSGPNTNGSQFFLVYEDTTLPSGYTIWGNVTAGLDILRGVAAAGVDGGGSDGAPTQSITIESATSQSG